MPCLIVELDDGSEKEIVVDSAALKAMYEYMQGWLATENISRLSKKTGITRQTFHMLRDTNVNIGIDKLGEVFDAYHKYHDQ